MANPRTNGSENPGPKSWFALHLWQIQFVRDAILIALVVGAVMLGYTLRTVTIPMLLAVALAYLFEPVVAAVTRSGRVSRQVVAVFIIFLAAVLVVVPVTLGVGFGVLQGAKYSQFVARNIDMTIKSVNAPGDARLRELLPERGWRQIRDSIVEEEKKRKASLEGAAPGEGSAAVNAADPAVDGAGSEPGVDPEVVVSTGESHGPVGEPSELYQLLMFVGVWLKTNAAALAKSALAAGTGAVDAAVTTLGSIFKFGFGGFLTAFFFFFFSTGYGRLLAFWHSLIPERRRGVVVDLLAQMDAVVAGFVRGRLTICSILIVYYSLAYWGIGVPAPLVVGLCVGLLTLVPYAAGAAVPVVMVLLWLSPPAGSIRDEWWWVVGAPLVVLTFQQLLDDYLLTPRIQGKTTNMDTPTILFASIAGGVLAGFYGLLLAIPVAACIKILLREVVWPRVRAWIQGRAEDPLPFEPGPKG